MSPKGALFPSLNRWSKPLIRRRLCDRNCSIAPGFSKAPLEPERFSGVKTGKPFPAAWTSAKKLVRGFLRPREMERKTRSIFVFKKSILGAAGPMTPMGRLGASPPSCGGLAGNIEWAKSWVSPEITRTEKNIENAIQLEHPILSKKQDRARHPSLWK